MTGVSAIRIDAEREQSELRSYLGAAYDHARLIDYQRQVEDELERLGDEQRFYRESQGYLYDLTAFAMTATKLPYLEVLVAAVPPPASVLDYGCGIGSDGLLLAEHGYSVQFADFDNPSTRYLRWRLERRGLDATIHDLDRGRPPGHFDAVFCFDVIEHADDPFALLAELEALGDLVVVNFLDPQPGETRLHRTLPVDALLAHAAGRRLRRYSRHHGRSHLVAYSPRRATPLRKALNRRRLGTGRRGAS